MKVTLNGAVWEQAFQAEPHDRISYTVTPQ